MQLEHSFTVPVGVDEAWKVLIDIERVAPCMPGAAVETIHGDDFTGTVKVKLGPINLTYKGKASFVEKDEAAHHAVISAQGRDARGNGTAAAKVTATLTAQGDSTKVDVITDLDITGKPAQFGRGVMVDVGNKLIGQFADCLAGKLTGTPEPAAAPAAPAKKAAAKRAAPAKKAAPQPAAKASADPSVSADGPAAPPAAEAPAEAPAAESPAAPAATEAPAAPTAAEAPAEASPGAAALAAGAVSAESAPEPAAVPAGQTAPRQLPTAEVEPIDLLEHAGPAVAKRLAPLVVALIVLLIILRRRKH